ncbi:MAG: hypothetical protein RLZZ198_603 [Bacteroidota bacterium]|jgi:hypothetical protein
MENNKVIQFAQAAYEHGRAKKIFDNFLIGGFSNGIISIMLLVVDFYEIPYVFGGILPYLIHAGFILMPALVIGILVSWFQLNKAKEVFESAQVVLLEDMYQRLKESN